MRRIGTATGRLPWRTCFLVAVCSVSACGGQAASPEDPGAAPAPAVAPSILRGTVPISENPEVITGDQIRETRAGNLWDALRRLRPQWLRSRGPTSVVSGSPTPTVYVQGIRYGAVRTLQNMNVAQVRRVEYVDPVTASIHFGTGHAAGVILVDLNRN